MADPDQQQALPLMMPTPTKSSSRTVRIIGFRPDKPIFVAFSPTMRAGNKKHGARHVDGSYETFGAAGLSLYKSAETAQRYNHSHRLMSAAELRVLAPSITPALVTILRPDELEPVNITPAERAEFYRLQISKWAERLFSSGLSLDEVAVVAENIMLEFGTRMRNAMTEETL